MDTLSDYMLLEIFQHLDQKSLVNCSETCKRWFNLTSNQIILFMGSQKKWRRTTYNEKSCAEIAEFRRQYRNIRIIGVRMTNQLYKQMKHQIASARKLHLSSLIISPSSFESLMENTTNTDELTLQDVDIIPSAKEVQRIPMPSLNKLDVTGRDIPNMLRFIGETSARVLCIGLNCIAHSICEKAAQEFLQMQHFVEDLTLSIWIGRHVPRLAAVPFKLRKLSLSSTRGNFPQEESIIEFLKPHQQTLKDLSLLSCGGARVMQYIATNLKIETLTIDKIDETEVIPENNFLQKLVMNSSYSFSIQPFRQLLKVYPSIQHLQIESVGNLEALMNDISNLSKLKSLRLNSSSSFFATRAQIRNGSLKSLHLSRINYPNSTFFELNMANLEELTIDQNRDSPIELVCYLPNLRCLSLLSRNFTISKSFLDEVAIHCTKLHTLKVLRSATNEKMATETKLHVHLCGEEFIDKPYYNRMIARFF